MPQHFAGSRDAEAQGIVLIHQEFNLAEHLTIAQNMFLGHEKRRGWFVDDAAMRAEAARYLAQVGLDKAPDTKVRELIVAEKQMVEIAKAHRARARVCSSWTSRPPRSRPSETERPFHADGEAEGRRRDHRLHLAQAR